MYKKIFLFFCLILAFVFWIFLYKNTYEKFYRYDFWDKKSIEKNKKKYIKKLQPPQHGQNTTFLFQTYHSKNKIPSDIYTNIKKFAPGYTHFIMDDKEIEEFLDMYFQPIVLHTFRSLKIGAHKADLSRYCLLYIFGGLYMDIKVELIKPLSNIFKNPNYFYTVISGNDDHIHQAIIKSQPENPLFLSLIDYIITKQNPLFYLDFCRDFYIQIGKDIGEFKEGLNKGESGIQYYLLKERFLNINSCYDGPDQYGLCCYVFDGKERVIKSRRASFPW